ncbi:MAG: hypothetical protein R6U13_12315 [Desulfatiglandaceae bacterium]
MSRFRQEMGASTYFKSRMTVWSWGEAVREIFKNTWPKIAPMIQKKISFIVEDLDSQEKEFFPFCQTASR